MSFKFQTINPYQQDQEEQREDDLYQ